MNYIIYTNRSSKTDAIISIIIGAILLFMPSLTGKLVIMAIGLLFIGFGASHLFTYYRLTASERNYLGLSTGIIPIVIGILIILFWDFILGFLPLVIGLIIIVNSVFALPMAIEQIKAKHYLDSILSCIAPLIIGILIVSNAFGVATFAISLFGLVLLAGGIIKLIS